ncbi:C2 calcium-dependent membrane targeting [Corchorus olitorius]|uniref:C2 calcium-dependent membrane targeting n=1 Tax=Corchorus olitorius TaxID=93759 RepID=A0A1R3KRG2_9ROSI|nr:C2 calcium-dependent membrane targeting [Corchorus olitorius]
MFENSSSQQQHDFTLEITVVSAQGLKTSSSLFSHRIRPFITLTSFPPSSFGGDKSRQVYKTKVDDHGGVNPTWGDKFYVPIDDNFFANPYSCVYLQLFTKRLISGHSQLGWFQIPAADVGLPPVGSVRQLSYRLRSEDGTRTQGIVNVAVKLDGPAPAPVAATPQQLPDDPCQTVIGIPVSYATWNGNGS